MTRLQAVDPATATGKTKELFSAVEKKLGSVPNMMRTMGNSVAVLNGYLSFSAASTLALPVPASLLDERMAASIPSNFSPIYVCADKQYSHWSSSATAIAICSPILVPIFDSFNAPLKER